MKSFLNFIRKNGLYAFINLFGLTVSLAFVLLLAVFVSRQLTTDAFQKNADRIYLYANENFIGSAYYLQKHLLDHFPEVEKATSYLSGSGITGLGELHIAGNDAAIPAQTSYADSSFFDIFSFPLLSGSVEAWKASDRSAVISRSFADAHFPGRDPVGQTLTYNVLGEDEGYTFTIAAVMEDIDHSVIKYCDVMCRADFMTELNSANDEEMSNTGMFDTFIMTWPNSDIQAKIPEIREYLGEVWWSYSENMVDKVFFIPLRDVYFFDESQSITGNINQGDSQLVRILLAACIILMLFAVLNYINLTVAQSGRRAKEMATRRLLGESRAGVIWRMIAEATAFAAVSTVLAVLIAEALAPYASRLLGYEFSVLTEITLPIALLIVVGIAVIGFLSGIIPALTISRAKPIEIVRGSFSLHIRSWFGKALIVIQQVVAVAMIAVSLMMLFQIRAMIHAPLGYNTEDILNVSSDIFTSGSQIREFREAVEAMPFVESAGFGEGTPLYGTNNNTMYYQGGLLGFQLVRGDSAYFNILGLRLKSDNHLAETAWYWNEYAFKEAGLPETATEVRFGNEKVGYYTDAIAGVYYDFKIRPLLYDQSAAMIYMYDVYPENRTPWNILVKVTGDHSEAYDRIAEAYSRIRPDGAFDASYIEDEIAATFEEYTRLQKIIIIFTVIAVFVSSLGLFAMSTYYIRARSRNIAVQKVFGADKRLVLRQIVFSYLMLSLTAFVVSVPVSWLLTSSWLNQFSYSTGAWLQWLLILASGVLSCAVAFLTVLYQSIVAINTNPVIALRKED
ncbi:MAG TPA: ABC transporter permease [Candidatus Coprenecus stercorigallinarum]|nr:ABC transporter permease [Candidatus Coprenecus stercorigallinarum]